jgi:hypothetical protein
MTQLITVQSIACAVAAHDGNMATIIAMQSTAKKLFQLSIL